MTALEIGSDTWLRTVTASKVPSILGLSPWTSTAETWLIMRGEIERDRTTSEVQRRGHDLEPMALRRFWRSKRRPGFVQETGEITVARDDLPFPAAASPDSTGRDDAGTRILCEAKTVGNFDSAKKWGTPGTDEIPVDYWVQVMWQLHMTQLDAEPITRGYVSLVGPVLDDHNVYVVEYDPAIAQGIEDRVAAFMASLDDPDACPPADGTASAVRIFAKRNPEIDRDERWQIDATLARDFVDAAADVEDAEVRLNTAKGEILRLMGRARIAYAVIGGSEVDVARRQSGARGAISLRNLKPTLDTAAAAAAA